jgi:hypothetical protein
MNAPNCDILGHFMFYNTLIYRYLTIILPHHFSSEDTLVGGGFSPTHFFGQKHQFSSKT